jgi:GxxExxY protein
MSHAERINEITEKIISAGIAVHKQLGPGLLESTYEACLQYEILQRGLKVERQKSLPVTYGQVYLDCGYRIDLIVERIVVVELKAIDTILPIHKAQLLSYLRLSGCPVGLLINFNVRLLKDGVRRIVNNFPDSPRSLQVSPRPLR